MLLIFLFVLFSVCSANIPPTTDYPHQAQLDAFGNVFLYWDSTETDITFEIHGRTNGWVGLGISPSGGMAGADIVVGWMQDTQVFIEDRHGVDGNAFPPIDPEQNVQVLQAIESNQWTMIKFRRQIPSCEPGYDLPITSDTLKIIYAYGEKDPENNEFSPSDYHVSNRGQKNLIILGITGTDETNFPESETHSTFELKNENFHVPSDTTYYNCRLFKLPEFTEKQHVVKISPLIQPGHEMLIHHMIMYHCTDSVTDKENIGEDEKCFSSNMPADYESCVHIIAAWAIGGGSIYFPSHTGLPLGDSDSPKYVMLETHYDNPLAQSGYVDSSGLEFTYTSQLREHDAGVMTTGMIISGINHLIPPNAESFLTHGECSQKCLEKGMEQGQVENLNVFGVVLHSHTIGAGVKLRHLRGTQELPFIGKDDFYDFNYQETRMLPEERVVQPGDSLQVICNYKTKGVRAEMTVGGLETTKEMCLVFVYYYPRIPLNICETGPAEKSQLKHYGIEKAKVMEDVNAFFPDISQMMILKPDELANQTVDKYLNSLPWNDETVNELSVFARDVTRLQLCYGTSGLIPGVNPIIQPPTIDKPYVEEEKTCRLTSPSETTTPGGVSTVSSSPWLCLLALLCLVFGY